MSSGAQLLEKRKHKASRYNTIDYHINVVKKRQKTIGSPSQAVVTSPLQPLLTSFLVEAESLEPTLELKKEEYFKVPQSKRGFNLLSLRRSFPSIKTNVNIIGLIKKNVLNNNIVKWTVQSKIRVQRTRTQVAIRDNNENATPSICKESLGSDLINRDYHRLYVEDFILLNVGDRIKVLIPDKALQKKNNRKYSFDYKFISCALEIGAPITQIGSVNNRFHVLSCEVLSSPNRSQAVIGIDRITLQNGLNGNQNFGSLLKIEDYDYNPLLKWRDVLNGRRDGLQVSNYSDSLRNNQQ